MSNMPKDKLQLMGFTKNKIESVLFPAKMLGLDPVTLGKSLMNVTEKRGLSGFGVDVDDNPHPAASGR